MEFTTLTETEFKKFAEKHPQFSFFQTPALAAYREKRGWRKYYVGLKNQNKILAATMMLSKPAAFKKKVFYAPRGPLIDYEDEKLLKIFFTSLKQYIKSQGGYVFRFDPYFEYRERDLDGKIVEQGFDHQAAIDNLKKLGIKIDPHPDQIKWLFALDLDRPPEELKKSFRQNTRNLINRTLRSEIKIRELKRDELKDFYKMCSRTAERKGFQKDNKPLDYYEDFYDLFGKDVKFLMAELRDGKETKQLSCGMFLLSGKREIIYLIAGNAEEYLDQNAQYLIQWEIINYAYKNGYKRYNFYGISGNFDKTDPAYGMYRFKKGFGGYVIELIGGFEMPVTKLYYLHKLKEKL
ncbi:peptidoglycan bridge formation glycyltransferase FemA/FemB family protein [Candidatus Saccharibacteria bacterium]|nr:peptidoglycan bridge formation glycyltransferase FemA/FemB family protein [Candidatus Saccharibacteria bacterium]MBQ9017138.1 peptidoglycan bridge formation glycyltransferase FemA/FemB family protein [Candidatus Saccharibacteria bacterium]